MAGRHHIDAAGHVLQSRVGLEAHVFGELLLRLLRSHALGQGDEHVRATAHTLFHEQYVPLAFGLQR